MNGEDNQSVDAFYWKDFYKLGLKTNHTWFILIIDNSRTLLRTEPLLTVVQVQYAIWTLYENENEISPLDYIVHKDTAAGKYLFS